MHTLPHQHAAHRCPECGGDVTRLRDHHPFTVVGSRMRVWAVFGVLLAAYLGVMIAGANWRVYNTGSQQQSTAHRQESLNPNANVVRGEVTADSRTLSDLNDALAGNEQLLNAFIANLREATEPFDHYGNRVSPQRIRLDLESPETRTTRIRNYQFFGPLVGTSNWQVYETAAKQVPVSPRDGTPLRTQVHWWPELHLQRDVPMGEHGTTRSINYINMLALIILAGLVAHALASLLSCVGVRAARRAPFRVGLIGAILLGCVAGAFLNPLVLEHNTPRHFSPIATGTWQTTEAVRSKLDDPAQAAALIRDMANFGSFHHDPTLAVTIARELDPNAAANAPPVNFSSSGFRVHLPAVGQTLNYRHVAYADARPQQPQTRSWWNDLLDYGWLNLTRNTQQDQYQARINILAATFLLAIPWLLWRGTNAVYSFGTARRQRKRVNRGQCIFCAYPLSTDALAARWEDATPPS